jgi:hypothetical protein
MTYRYPWPASALSPADMKLLHHARERDSGRRPITRLIAEAVRVCFSNPNPAKGDPCNIIPRPSPSLP